MNEREEKEKGMQGKLEINRIVSKIIE